MGTLPNIPRPIKRVGYRNVFCRFYNHCLDYAVDKKWLTFACPKTCRFINDSEDVAAHPAGASSMDYHRAVKWEADM